jgi:peptidoglycan glycosyltransferase
VQAWFAFANGGLFGTGLGQGSPNKIPAVQNDYIFAAIGEELGLVGATAILIAFLLMSGAGLSVAVKAQRPFENLLATGLTTILGVQAFVIMGGVTRLLPLTGVTLPFVSYGGSSLIVLMAAIGLLLSVSRETMEPSQAGGSDARAHRGWRNGGASLPSVRRSSYGSPTPYRR